MCTFPIGTKDYDESPCCNEVKALTQCCAPHDGTVGVLKIQKVLEGSVGQTCKTKSKITALLADAVSSISDFREDQAEFSTINNRGPTGLFSAYSYATEFIDYCTGQIFSTPCQTDNNCPFGMKCGVYNRCNIETENLIQVVTKCAIFKMVYNFNIAIGCQGAVPFGYRSRE